MNLPGSALVRERLATFTPSGAVSPVMSLQTLPDFVYTTPAQLSAASHASKHAALFAAVAGVCVPMALPSYHHCVYMPVDTALGLAACSLRDWLTSEEGTALKAVTIALQHTTASTQCGQLPGGCVQLAEEDIASSVHVTATGSLEGLTGTADSVPLIICTCNETTRMVAGLPSCMAALACIQSFVQNFTAHVLAVAAKRSYKCECRLTRR